MSRLSLSVVGGYLGAGKTTVINRLLGGDHGLRLAVLVNDFGAINIDAALLQSASADTIELTNGCVCCTMTGDLFYAIGDMLDRTPRPDHLIIEASGIADPAKIAAVAQAEPDLRYAGILTVVDGVNFPRFAADPLISDQVKAQVRCADFVVVSKDVNPAVIGLLEAEGIHHWHSASDTALIEAMLLGHLDVSAPRMDDADGHRPYVQWSMDAPPACSRAQVDAMLATLPRGVLRCKALLPDGAGQFWEIHAVGQVHDVTTRNNAAHTGVVVIGPEGAVTQSEIKAWWAHHTHATP